MLLFVAALCAIVELLSIAPIKSDAVPRERSWVGFVAMARLGVCAKRHELHPESSAW